ncbi:MAG TPA: macro domain-containing protein [Nitrososphaeraceae archaeon]|jgi:O-acetyl-ADP-ribose deacetylase (regulator of RNase III)
MKVRVIGCLSNGWLKHITVVNAANSYLKHGAGVAGAIVRKGGSIIHQESDKIGYVEVGSAVITTLGKLPCKAVIHTVGPRICQESEDKKLRKAVQSSLKLAADRFKSISVPAISSWIFGYPKERCAKILLDESKSFLISNDISIEIIEFCIFDIETLDCFKTEFFKFSQIVTNNLILSLTLQD